MSNDLEQKLKKLYHLQEHLHNILFMYKLTTKMYKTLETINCLYKSPCPPPPPSHCLDNNLPFWNKK